MAGDARRLHRLRYHSDMRRCLQCSALVSRGSRCPVHQAQHDAKRRPTQGRAGVRIRAAIHARDAGRPCSICGQPIMPGEAVHVDHVRALARGGSDDPSNLRTAHKRCNLSKGAK